MRHGVCLAVDSVSKNFGGLRAVWDVSFEVHFGQIVALIGPNGAGKSTLFNVVSGIETPSGGRVLLEGADLADVPIHQRGASIGRSFQVPRLVPDLTAVGNVVARLDHMPGGPDDDMAQRIARQHLDVFGLSEFADMPVEPHWARPSQADRTGARVCGRAAVAPARRACGRPHARGSPATGRSSPPAEAERRCNPGGRT